jgi:hypothetical protein
MLKYVFVTIDDNDREVELAVDPDFTPSGEPLNDGDTILLEINGHERPWKIVSHRQGGDDEVRWTVEPPMD